MSLLIYKDIIDPSSPDRVYEQFWLDFKTAVSNEARRLPAFIDAVSAELNSIRTFHQEGWVDSIQITITTRILLYLGQILSSLEQYHLQILLDHVYRWLKICIVCGTVDTITLHMFYDILKSRSPLAQELKDQLGQILQDRISGGSQQKKLVIMLMENRQSARVDRLLKNPFTRPITISTIMENYGSYNPCSRMKSSSKLMAAINESKTLK